MRERFAPGPLREFSAAAARKPKIAEIQRARIAVDLDPGAGR